MHHLVQDVIFISLALIFFLALFQGAQRLMRSFVEYRSKPEAPAPLALRDVNNPP